MGLGFKTTLVNLFFVGLLSTFLLVGTSSKKALVNLPALQFYGFISYGLYLLHMLAFDAYDAVAGHRTGLEVTTLGIRFLVVLSVSTLLCWISRRTFEELFLGLKDKTIAVPERTLTKAAVGE